MRQLPKGWVKTELKQLISISSGKNLTQKKMVEGDVPVFGGNGITGWHNEGNISKPSIVIGRVGFYCGSVHITPDNAWVTDNAFITTFPENHLDITFLYWLLTFTDLRQNDSSSAQPVISGQKVYPIKVNLPPLAEQQRIVEKLDEVLAQVDTIKARLDGIPAIIKRFRQSVLAAAVSGKLTEEWRGGSEYTFCDEAAAEFPDEWDIKLIGDIAEIKGGKRLPKGEELVSDNTGYPYIRAGQLKNGTVVIGDNARNTQMYLLPHIQYQISRYVVSEGDAYITIVGASIGDAGIIPMSHHGANLTENAAKICNFIDGFSSDFLALWLRSEILQQLVKLEIKSGAQGKLALKRIKTLPVPSTSIEEQKEIVRLVDQYFAFADTIEAQVKKAQARVDNLTQSILAKAFRGELVPQDPEDEPADKLLERIAEARKEAEALAKAAKKAEAAKKRAAKKAASA